MAAGQSKKFRSPAHWTLSQRLEYYSHQEGECRIWDGQKIKHPQGTGPGYGRLRYKGSRELAHRLAWIAANGPIPEGMNVLHNCPNGDRRDCIEPAHLFLGNQADNSLDCALKGRTSRAERHPKAKLTNETALAIYHAQGSLHEIAQRFNCPYPVVCGIRYGLTWTSVTGHQRKRKSKRKLPLTVPWLSV